MPIRDVVPNFAEYGDRLTVTINGDGLQNTNSSDFGPGITIIRTTMIDDGKVEVKIEVLDEAPRGPHNVLLLNGGGIVADRLGGFTVR